MTTRPLKRPVLAALGLATLALLAGCAGAPTRIHTLESSGPATAAAAWTRGAFRIDAVHVPPAFDRPELVRRTDSYTVTLSDNDRWAAPLGELVRRALTQDLERRLPAGVVIYPDAPKPPAAAGLVIDILSVHPEADGVTMDASWTWVAARAPATRVTVGGMVSVAPHPPVATPSRPVHLTAPAVGGGVPAIAPELSTLLALLADRIAADDRG